MLQFYVKCVIKDPLISTYSVILESTDGNYLIPIPVGPFEAEAIYAHLSSLYRPRPMTYDFVNNILKGLGDVKIVGMYIDVYNKGVYEAKLAIDHSGNIIKIDCRPSDGIAVTIRADAPIYIDEDIAKKNNCVSKNCLSTMERILLEQLIMDQEMRYL
ncbi:MAG: bifunctional nuclease family protein [Deferribacterales bacterium]